MTTDLKAEPLCFLQTPTSHSNALVCTTAAPSAVADVLLKDEQHGLEALLGTQDGSVLQAIRDTTLPSTTPVKDSTTSGGGVPLVATPSPTYSGPESAVALCHAPLPFLADSCVSEHHSYPETMPNLPTRITAAPPHTPVPEPIATTLLGANANPGGSFSHPGKRVAADAVQQSNEGDIGPNNKARKVSNLKAAMCKSVPHENAITTMERLLSGGRDSQSAVPGGCMPNAAHKRQRTVQAAVNATIAQPVPFQRSGQSQTVPEATGDLMEDTPGVLFLGCNTTPYD